MRNDLAIHDTITADWWSDNTHRARALGNPVQARSTRLDRQIDREGEQMPDPVWVGGFLAKAKAKVEIEAKVKVRARAKATSGRAAHVTGIDPATQAIGAARAQTRAGGRRIGDEVRVGEPLPSGAGAFDTVVCLAVPEHVDDLNMGLAKVSRVQRAGRLSLHDAIIRNPLTRLATALAKAVLRPVPRGTDAPAICVRPQELRRPLQGAGRSPGPMIGRTAGPMAGRGPRGVNRRLDLILAPRPRPHSFTRATPANP